MLEERASMITKALKRKEVELGFIHIPIKSRAELIGGIIAPFDTKLNNFPAKIDRQGRLRCSKYLKDKFPINTEVAITKDENGFQISLDGQKQESSTPENIQMLGIHRNSILLRTGN